MKKVVCVLLAVLMLFVCACQGGGKGGDKSGDTKTKATESGMPIVNETVNLSVSQCIRDVDELAMTCKAPWPSRGASVMCGRPSASGS